MAHIDNYSDKGATIMNAEIKDMTEWQIADLEAQIKAWRKEKEHKPLAWKPKKGDKYYIMQNFGSPHCQTWAKDSLDKSAYAIGNVFPNRELAEAEIKRRQVKRQIEELIDRYDSEHGGSFIVGEYNCYFMYYVDGEEDHIVIGDTRYSKVNNLPCFSSNEVAERILEEIGEDNIKLLFTEYPIGRSE